ncbi:MAG: ABC transporter permease, partial [Thermoplasmata archaeon]|nr:ABC transporter permease [Thermoplasmata archaeon]
MNMRRVMANLTVHIKQFSREKSTIFFVLAFPILLMLLFGFIFSDVDNVTYQLPVQDNDDGYWSNQLIDGINNSSIFEIVIVDPSENPNEYLNSSGQNTILVIPSGFSEQINNTKTVYYYLGEALNATSEAMNHS